MPDKNEALLKEIRDRYKYAKDAWKDIRDEAATDMRYVVGQPWDAKDLKDRADAGRPALVLDELSQYRNQAINNLRQNKRGIKIDPDGGGSTEESAKFLQGLIRGIEYNSNAQQCAYIPAFESALNRSYGFFEITRDYVGDGFEQEIKIEGIQNPDCIVYDPDTKKADWSDAKYCFKVEPIRRDEFSERWPDAEKKDFTAEDIKTAPDWIQNDTIVVAVYWRITTTPQEIGEGERKRTKLVRKLTKYITNGVEILEETEQPGTYIPIVPIIGEEQIYTDGGQTNRVIKSLIRLARDPQMLLNYYASQEAEEASMTPKSPAMGYKGQFESDWDNWQTINKIPHAFLQVDPVVDGAAGQILPLPIRPQFQPNFQVYEIAKEAARRHIQAALGISPLPTSAQRQNEKSGVALERIQQQEAIGSFHFIDNFDRGLQLAGRIIMEWVPVVYDTERELGLVMDDETRKVVRINTPGPDENGEHYLVVDEQGNPVGNHGVTISTGPSYQSQKDAADDFVDVMVGQLKNLPLAPPQMQKILSLGIKLKNLGPLGDQMAEIVDPQDQDENSPEAMQQQLQVLGQQHQQLTQALNNAMQVIETKQVEKQAEIEKTKIVEASRFNIEKMKIEADILKAQITTKAQETQTRDEMTKEVWSELHGSAHELAMQSEQQAHDMDMADMQGQQAQQLAAQNAALSAQNQQPAQ